MIHPSKRFQFTPPGRGATTTNNLEIMNNLVSIHAPREGCDASLLLTSPEF